MSVPGVPPTYDCADPDARLAGLAAAARAVRSGQLVVLPTDTLYGLGADAFTGAAVRSLLAAKGRGPDMPVPVLVGSWNTIDGLVTTVPAAARELVEAFWPGGLSLVLPHAPSLTWDLGVTRGTVMLRMPLAPRRAGAPARDRADGRVERERLRPPAGHHGRRGDRAARGLRSRCTSTAARAGWASRRRSST